MKKIGFIGAGNMAKAIIKGLLASEMYQPEEILVYNHRYEPTLKQLTEELDVVPVLSLKEIVEATDQLVLAVKPFVFTDLLAELSPLVKPNHLLISIAAGITLQQMEQQLPADCKIVRVMPNTPALVGEGMSSISVNEQVTEEEKQFVRNLLLSFGKAEFVAEDLMDAVIGVSGSAPAYVYMFIEALADGAVAEGMPRTLAYEFAAQAVLGSAKMVLETKEHPGVLKDMVTSPKGTTIEAVRTLEENQFRGTVMKAVHAAAEKNRQMSKD